MFLPALVRAASRTSGLEITKCKGYLLFKFLGFKCLCCIRIKVCSFTVYLLAYNPFQIRLFMNYCFEFNTVVQKNLIDPFSNVTDLSLMAEFQSSKHCIAA